MALEYWNPIGVAGKLCEVPTAVQSAEMQCARRPIQPSTLDQPINAQAGTSALPLQQTNATRLVTWLIQLHKDTQQYSVITHTHRSPVLSIILSCLDLELKPINLTATDVLTSAWRVYFFDVFAFLGAGSSDSRVFLPPSTRPSRGLLSRLQVVWKNKTPP